MEKYSKTVTDLKGNAVVNASVRITTLDGALAVIYTDAIGTVAANPTPVDATGRFSFYAVNGHYSAQVYVGGVLYGSLTDITLFDPADNPSASLAQLAAPGGGALVKTVAAVAGAVARTITAKGRDVVSILDVGMVADWNGTTGTDNGPKLAALLADTSISKIIGAPGSFWFGNIVGDSTLATVGHPLVIDWAGAKLFAGETNPTAGNVATAFIKVLNTGRFRMENFEFTDTTFAFANNSRGIQPIQIMNTGTSVTSGYSLGPFHVHAGQSLLTVASNNAGVAVAKQINFVGSCRGGTVYYGVNLANSGDQFHGVYTLENVYRSAYVYGVEDVTIKLHSKATQASSANLLVNAKAVRPTRNIKIEATLDVLNGPVLVTADTGTGAILDNIDIDVYARTDGGNAGTAESMVSIGAMDSGSNWTASDTATFKGIRVRARPLFRYAMGNVAMRTAGANVGLVDVTDTAMSPYWGTGTYKNTGVHFKRGNKTAIGGIGDLASSPVKIDLKKIIPLGPRIVMGILRVMSFVGEASMTMKEYRLAGFFASDGTHTIAGFSATQVSTVQAGAYNPIITVTADGLNYVISASSGGSASAYTVVELEFLDNSV